MKPFLGSFVCLGAFVTDSEKFRLLGPNDPQKDFPVDLTAEILMKPWIYRYCYIWMTLFFIQQKSYFA